MIRGIKFLLTIFLFGFILLSFASFTSAATINAASCSQANVQTAINSASNGDIVNVPAGSCTWSNRVTWSNKNIQLIGAGIGNTNIVASSGFATITVGGSNEPKFRISGFTISGSGSPVVIAIWGTDSPTLRGAFRIDHIKMDYPTSGSNGMIQVWGPIYGLIDHNEFIQLYESVFLTGMEVSGEVCSYNFAWQGGSCSTSTLSGGSSASLPFEPGSPRNLYIEDNTFRGLSDASHQIGTAAVDTAYSGGRYVIRNNVLTDTHLYAHWTAAGSVNSLWWEIYNNRFIFTLPQSTGMYPMRMQGGGTGIIRDNTITGYPSNYIMVGDGRLSDQGQSGSPTNYCNGAQSVDGNAGDANAPGWPCLAQIGRAAGKTIAQIQAGDKQTSFPLYIWNNGPQEKCANPSAAGAACDNSFNVNTFNSQASQYIKSTPHVTSGFGNGDVDYSKSASKPSGAGTHTLSYTPFTYPYPLDANGMPDPTGSGSSTCTNCRYVRQGATGTNNGSDWTNAYTALPATLTRGYTYYIATGSYAGRTFNTAASGTQYITIKGATTADHGTDTGWQNSYSVDIVDGGTQATWTSGLTFSTSYWIFDGSAGPNWSKNKNAYGFKFNTQTGRLIEIYNTASTVTDVMISHVTATTTLADVEKIFVATNDETRSVHDVTLSHSLVDGWQGTVWATSAGLNMNNWVVEYMVILNGYSSAAVHGEDLNNNYGYMDNFTIRYNWFEGRIPSTASITCLNGPCGNYYIYGNVFKDMFGGDGIITGVHYPLKGEIFNNVFINVDSGYNNGQWIGHDVQANVHNNIVYDSDARIGGNFGGTKSHNAYFNTVNTPSENNGYNGGNINPFVNVAGGDASLISSVASAMPAGITLNNLNNKDAFGNTRGLDGKWDRGAYEFSTGGAVNGACGSTQNSCTSGTLNDIVDNSTHYLWQCVGSGGGSTASCSLLIPVSVPTISVQPVSQSKYIGESVTFSVTASGNPTPIYQWRENGVNISGATSSSYTKSNVQLVDSGRVYSVVVSNSQGSVTSSSVTLTVSTMPNFTAPTFVAEYETPWNNANTPKTVSLTGLTAGDVLVAYAGAENDGGDITIGGGLTWTERQSIDISGYAQAYVWTTNVSQATATVTFTGGSGIDYFGGNVLVFRNSDGIGNSGKNNQNNAAPSLSLTTTQDRSAIVVFSSDYVPVDGTLRTWMNSAGTFSEQSYGYYSGKYTHYGGYHGDSGNLGSKTVGLSAPNGQKYSIVAVEVLGKAQSTPSANYHPADSSENGVLSSAEVSAYINSYFAGSVTMVQALYAVTLLQQGGDYTITGSSNCAASPWSCWTSL